MKRLKDMMRTNSLCALDRQRYFSIEELREVAIEWIEHLFKQEGIYPWDSNKFDFDNQLDDFINRDGEYKEVIAWIRWFFCLPHDKYCPYCRE